MDPLSFCFPQISQCVECAQGAVGFSLIPRGGPIELLFSSTQPVGRVSAQGAVRFSLIPRGGPIELLFSYCCLGVDGFLGVNGCLGVSGFC